MVFHKRRRRRRRKKSLMSKVKSVVKREVGKTVETAKMVSYLSWSSIPPLIDDAAGTSPGLVLSLTGGLQPQNDQTVMQPGVYTDKQLFTLLPAGSQISTNNVQQANQGGNAMELDAAGNVENAAIGGVHCLEGREAFLKSWYATLILSNSPQQVVDPRPCFVRMVVFETRRPLAQNDIAQQIFLQNHAVNAMNATVSSSPETVCSYLNRDIIKKVFYDKLVKLTGPAQAGTAGASSAQLYTTKIRVRINRKCRWTYYYATRDPVQTDESLTYMGPFIYCVFCASQTDENRYPQLAMNTMLTFQDD